MIHFYRIFSIFFMVAGIINTSYGQDFQIQFSTVSSTEWRFDVTYTGPDGEITLPERGRLISLGEDSNAQFGSNKIRVGISPIENASATDTNSSVSSPESSSTSNTVSFSYTLIIGNQGNLGSMVENWYPIFKNTDSSYTIFMKNGFIFPYTERSETGFKFSTKDNPKFVLSKFTVETGLNTALPITLFKGISFDTSIENIEKIYSALTGIFGDLNIKEIVIINSPLVNSSSFINKDTLYLSIPGRGTVPQVKYSIANSWINIKTNLSPRLFHMLKDAVLRIHHIALTGDTNASQGTAETDPAKVIPVPASEYYKNLLQTGFQNGALVDVNAKEMLKNKGILHMAWFNIGAENFINGIKSFFAQQTSEAVSDTETKEASKNDLESIDWNTITQNKLAEPLLSLYTKEVLSIREFEPKIIASGSKVVRNSSYIPDLKLGMSDGSIIDIKWNNTRTVTIDVKSGNYHVDPERQIPQKNYIESYYTFDTNETRERLIVLSHATRNKIAGEFNLREHLDLMKFTAEAGNGFNIEPGTTVYIVVSHILSTSRGYLQDAIKESVFTVNDKQIVHIATRVRI